MTPLDYTCSHFDVPANFVCMAQPGAPCMWPDGKGGREAREQFHPERVEAAGAMKDGPGEVQSVAKFDKAVEQALDGDLEGLI